MTSRRATKQNQAVEQFNRALDLEVLVPLQRRYFTEEDVMGEFPDDYGLTEPKGDALTNTGNKLESMRTILARFLARNMMAIPLDVLKQLKWTHAKLIWDIVCEENLDTLNVFAKFAVAFPNDLAVLKTLHCAMQHLPEVLESIASVSFRHLSNASQKSTCLKQPWLLCLDLSHIPVSQEVLLQLGAMPALTSLAVNDAGITDETIRHWSRAQSVGHFSSLKFLDIRANSSGIKHLPKAMELLLRFEHLEFIRSDYMDSDIYKNTKEEDSGYKATWSALFNDQQCTLALTAHLGSHADHRPVSWFQDSMIVNVKSSRAKAQKSTTVIQHERPNILLRRKQKKQKKLQQIGTDIWKNGF